MPADPTPHARALPPGKTPERVTMRAGEERALLIDCSALLSDGERIESAAAAQAQPAGLRVMGATRVRASAGTIEVILRAMSADDARARSDYRLTCALRTTRGQRLSAVVGVRVLS